PGMHSRGALDDFLEGPEVHHRRKHRQLAWNVLYEDVREAMARSDRLRLERPHAARRSYAHSPGGPDAIVLVPILASPSGPGEFFVFANRRFSGRARSGVVSAALAGRSRIPADLFSSRHGFLRRCCRTHRLVARPA